MFLQSTVIMPAAGSQWELWRCGSRSSWQGSTGDPAKGTVTRGHTIIALPARSCRTFAFVAPTEDATLVRKLAFAQLEKRGLTTTGADQTPFDCRVLRRGEGHSVVSVDVLTSEAAAQMAETRVSAMVAGARLFTIPEGKLVVMEEQGRLVLCAGAGGHLLHSQIVSVTPELNGHTAPEIHIATLALQQQGVLGEVKGIELWGDFSAGESGELARQLDLPVEIKARPSPDPSAVRKEAGPRLLPLPARLALRRRKFGLIRWAAPAALLIPVAWLLLAQRQKLIAMESKAAAMESMLDTPGEQATDRPAQERMQAERELVAAVQKRWTALRHALEPRRYPVALLDGLSRCQSGSGIVLTRFESKITDVTVSGTAGSAMDAYQYFSTVGKDLPLGVYAWSMGQPAIAADGSVSFEMKGKMK